MRLVFLSFLPLVIIIFFNFKVYKDIKERSNRSFELKGSPETKVSTMNVSDTYLQYFLKIKKKSTFGKTLISEIFEFLRQNWKMFTNILLLNASDI